MSPATGHADTEWFDEFWLQCEILGCRYNMYIQYVSLDTDYRIDYLATHWYKSTQGAELTINVGLVDDDLDFYIVIFRH